MSEAIEPGKGGMAAILGLDLSEIERVLKKTIQTSKLLITILLLK